MAETPIFVINLARSTQRLRDLNAQFEARQLSFERIEAVDGAQLPPMELARWYDEKALGGYHKQLNPGEVACYLSHRLAWQMIVDRDLPFALVLEDDINLVGDVSQTLKQLSALPADWDYIKLAEHNRRRNVLRRESLVNAPGQRIVYQKVPARTCAQAVSLTGAKKLLACSQKIHRPIDIDLQYWWEKELRVFGLLPYAIEPNADWDSEIDKTRLRSAARQDSWLKKKLQLSFIYRNYLANQRRMREINTADN